MTVLLVIIYLAFISLGLPDSVLGSAWPIMHQDLGVAIAGGGAISMTVSAGTIISSLMSDRLINKFSAAAVTLVSVIMTAAALLGISFAGNLLTVCLWAVPLGLGAGSVDAALNNFVALHYKASHMSWLHSFWGVGTIISPLVISAILRQSGQWSSGYRYVSFFQFGFAVILAISLPLWKRAERDRKEHVQEQQVSIGLAEVIRLPKAKPVLTAFFCYCALEQTVILWGCSYLVVVRGIQEAVASGWISLFFIGITAGRMLSGFLSMKFSQRNLITTGIVCMAAGILVLFLPVSDYLVVAGLFLIGMGCAPVFPCLLHETPNTFGKANSQAMMGIQMASAYVGTTFVPPLFGLIGGKIGYSVFPYFLGVLLIVMTIMIKTVYAGRNKK